MYKMIQFPKFKNLENLENSIIWKNYQMLQVYE